MGQAGEASALPTLPEMQTLARKLAALLRKHDTGAVALVRHVRVSVACLIPAVRAAAGVLESDLRSERCRTYNVRAAVPEQAASGGRSTLLVVATTETVRPVATAADRARLQGAVEGAVGELREDGVTRIDAVPVLRETRHVLQFRRVGDMRAHAATLAAALLAGLPVSVPPVAVVNVTVEAYCREERVAPSERDMDDASKCVRVGHTEGSRAATLLQAGAAEAYGLASVRIFAAKAVPLEVDTAIEHMGDAGMLDAVQFQRLFSPETSSTRTVAVGVALAAAAVLAVVGGLAMALRARQERNHCHRTVGDEFASGHAASGGPQEPEVLPPTMAPAIERQMSAAPRHENPLDDLAC